MPPFKGFPAGKSPSIQVPNAFFSQLLPLIDGESRPALWVLVTVYHSLLKRIERSDYDVFTRRASVPTVTKMGILAVGMMRMAWARVFG